MATREAERTRMITAEEAAAQLGVKLGTLYAYVSRGWLRSYRRRIGRQALYRREDIDALRDLATAEGGRRGRSLPDASSWVTVAQPPSSDGSAYGVIVAESAVSSIIEGRLAYRGYPVEELIARASFEEVCLLLWNGERPQPGAVAALAPGDRADRGAGTSRRGAPRGGRRRFAAAAAGGRDAGARLARAPSRHPSDGRAGHANHERVAAWHSRVGGRAAPPAQEWRRVLRASVCMRPPPSGRSPRSIASWSRAPSTSLTPRPSRRAWWLRTGADLYASVLAALCSLSGPIHGGACDRIEQMFAQIDAGTRLEECLAAFSVKWRLPPGFGHAIYPAGDPRAVLLKKEAAEIARHRGRRLFETALRIEETVWRRERLRPNLDFYLTVCARMLGFARGLPAAIFAVGRAAGWIAHSLEQYADNRLIRPRMRYRGVPMRHWT